MVAEAPEPRRGEIWWAVADKRRERVRPLSAEFLARIDDGLRLVLQL